MGFQIVEPELVVYEFELIMLRIYNAIGELKPGDSNSEIEFYKKMRIVYIKIQQSHRRNEKRLDEF